MSSQTDEASPQTYARIGGLLYLFIIVAAAFGELFVRNRLVVWGDVAATASNILGSETLFRIGLVGEMLTCVCDVALALILYVLLRPISRNLALLAAFFRVTFDLPRIIGILLAIAGFGYVGFSVAQMLSPAFAARALFPWVFPMAFVVELALCLWLMVRGVDIARWTERTQR